MNEKIEARLAELRAMSDSFAKAFAERTYLEKFREAKLAMLMKEAESRGFSQVTAQDREARAHPEYAALLANLRTATEESERLRWHLEVAKMGVAVWQTQNANERAERRAYGA
jgi:hypothetical protein